MALPINNRIGGQNEAYRKGLVLGLTMAEVGILIIFVLLLLLVLGEIQRGELLRQSEGRVSVSRSELSRLTAAQTTLQTIAQELGVSVPDTSEDFTRLVRVVHEAVNSPDAGSKLAEASSALADIKRARDELQRITATAGSGEFLSQRVEQQAFQLANQEGQLRRFQTQLRAAGPGKGERPCWVQPTGTIDFLYEVVLTSDGIKMRELSNPTRERERALLPAPTVDQRELLSENAFLTRTRPLFEFSKQNDCRFFVVVYDATASYEKPIYKDHLKAVERHFYKRLSDASPPF